MEYPTVYSLFADRVKKYAANNVEPKDVFYFRSAERWQGISWQRFEQETFDFAVALLSLGLKCGGSICILMGNVPEWPISDIGTIMAGGVGVGLYPTSSAEQVAYIINHSDAEFVLVDSHEQLQKVLSVRDQLAKVRQIITLDESSRQEPEAGTGLPLHAAPANGLVSSYRDLIARGRSERARLSPLLKERAEGANPDDIAIMVYTSGTTGLPKGACLSHRYIINSVESLRQTIPIYDTDVSFSYLPFCHVAERISGLYNRLYAGASAYFVDDLARLGEYMLEVKPTVFASLPRFFEKIYARAVADMQRLPVAEWPDFKSTRVKDYFGGRIRLATSGGAPLPLEVAEFFAEAGLPILQAYGLTENVCVAFNRPDNYKFGTVGPPMPGCEVRLANDKEILVRSEMMFSGYYKAPEETAKVFSDGWLLTGDLGEFDEDGFLKIIGRKKELIVTSTGKKISPALLENMLKEHHVVSQAMVYGEGRSYLVALITLNSPAPRETIQGIIESVNQRVSSTESIKRFAILDRDFEIGRDELTPTGKLKRDVITECFRDVIEKLYLATDEHR
ncbi:MAG TPA: AMP-dependent synthetase/ligase [Pyrinomonadaceae bacterium]|jgi:long-chain acyl-CoA synthetase|nr:AMP-dependent synthetase/ligase [Pyrinomonadaceae bacterium]